MSTGRTDLASNARPPLEGAAGRTHRIAGRIISGVTCPDVSYAQFRSQNDWLARFPVSPSGGSGFMPAG